MTTPHATPLEIEIKFAAPPGLRQRLEAHPMFDRSDVASPKAVHQVSTYFDTPELALAASGLTLRIRTAGNSRMRVQTLKSASNGTGGLASRGEWEWPVRVQRPDITLLSDTPASGHALDRLEPMVVTEINRTTWLLRLDGGTAVEAALDEGTITAGEASLPVHELELELKAGPPAPLYRLAQTLAADLKLRLEAEPKSTRGFRLRTARPPESHKPPKPALDPNITMSDGFHQIMVAALGSVMTNLPAAAAGEAEGIHQMRIAVRRARTAIALFKPHLAPDATDRFSEELRHLGQVLGTARDWDVFTADTLSTSLKPARRRQLQPTAEAARQNALQKVQQELAAPRLTSLILALAAWTGDGSAIPDPAIRSTRLAALAPTLLERMARKVRKRARHITRLSGVDLHRVRKSLKKLRYAVDDLGSLFPRKAVKGFGKRCAGMQDQLGTVNDAAMAVNLATSLARDGQPGRIAATAAITRHSHKRRRKAARRLPGEWKDLRHATPFWR